MLQKNYSGKWYCLSEIFHDNHNTFLWVLFMMTFMLHPIEQIAPNVKKSIALHMALPPLSTISSMEHKKL